LSTAISRDNGKTGSNAKILEGNLNGGYCYIGIHVMEDAVLLSYCAMDWLCHTRIAKLPISYLYADGPKEPYYITPGFYDSLPNGPFTTIQAAPGTWTVTNGAAEVLAYTRGKGLRLQGGSDVTMELALPQPIPLKNLQPLALERFTGAPSYHAIVEAMKDGQWVKVCEHGDGVRPGSPVPIVWTQPELTTDKLRVRCTSAGGTIVCDGKQKVVFNSCFKD
jgi:hypothetical protein